MKPIFIFFIAAELALQMVASRLGWGIANNGISFGMIKGISILVISVSIIIFYLISGKLRKDWGFGLLLAGGIANLAGRIFFGTVWDYIKLPVFNLWFNGADLMISMGVLKLLLHGN